MQRALAAAAAYFAIVFSLAFGLGMARTLFVAPRTGDVVAVLIETPIILSISCLAAAWTARRLSVPTGAPERLAMGAAALALLLIAETALALTLFGRPLAQQFAAYASPAGAIGLLAQFAFGFMPWLAARRL